MSSAGDNGRGGTPPQDVFPHDVRRASVAAVGRACFWVAVLVTAYAVLPLDRLADVSPLISLPLALVGFAAVLAVQVLAIARSTLPGVRAIEALATSVTLLVVIFASAYYVASVMDASAFTQPLTKLDSFYFTVTVFATVGFGDIGPRTQSARFGVTVQMVVDLLVVGIGLRLIIGAVRHARLHGGGPPPDDA